MRKWMPLLAVLILTGIYQLALAGNCDYQCLKAKVVDERRISKAIPLSHNIDAFTAYKMYKQNPEIVFVDVRSPEEFQLIGHIPWSYNIPVKFITNEWNPKKNKFMFKKNPRFIKDFMAKFPDKNKTYIILCRSGHRSRIAVKELVKAGYRNIYQMWEGFEGIKIPYKFAPSHGKRFLDGWRNRGLPWTYKQDPEHAYLNYELINR